MTHVITHALMHNVWKLARCKTCNWPVERLSHWYDRVKAAREQAEYLGARPWPDLERFDCVLEGLSEAIEYRLEDDDWWTAREARFDRAESECLCTDLVDPWS